MLKKLLVGWTVGKNFQQEIFFSHVTDFLRMAHLYNYGGSYMDFDVLVLHTFSQLRNAVGLDNATNAAENPVYLYDSMSYICPAIMINFDAEKFARV